MGEYHSSPAQYVIIVAGGKGLRMGTDVPKQFLPVGGVPVLMRTIRRFREYNDAIRVILVLPRHQQEYWRSLCCEYSFGEEYVIADGGETRFHSVRNGLSLIPDSASGVVGVHDGVRPFPSVDTIRRCYEEAARSGAAVPVTPVVETLRHVLSGEQEAEGEVAACADERQMANCVEPKCSVPSSSSPFTHRPSLSKTVPRSEYRLVQTPQCFSLKLLKEAYRQSYTDLFTDDASVVESLGHDITLTEGNRENIKLTTPFDLVVGEALCNAEQ